MLAIIELLLPILTQVVGKIIPDAGKAAEVNAELQKALIERQGEIDKAVAEAAKAQAEVNLKEAEHPSLFVSGWRPAVGWICVAGCFYGFALQPTLAWFAAMVGVAGPPTLDMATLIGLLTGLLGLGSLRTYEKVQGVEQVSLGRPILRRTA
jgi:hypothetical protein